MAEHSEWTALRETLAQSCTALSRNDALSVTAQMAASDVARAPDLLSAMQAAGHLLLLLEDVSDASAKAAQQIKEKLLFTMLECGAPQIKTGDHLIGWADGKASVRITGDVPAQYMRQPDPVPDKAEIKAAIQQGIDVPGAVLSNGQPYLFIRARKAKP